MNNLQLNKLKHEYLYPERIRYQHNFKRTYKYHPLNETKKIGSSFIKLEELLKKKNLKLIPNNDIKQLILNFSKENNIHKLRRRNSSDILTTSTIYNNNKLPIIKSSKEFYGLNILSNQNSGSNITKRNNENTITTKIETKKRKINLSKSKDRIHKSSSQDNIFDTEKISNIKKNKLNLLIKIKGTFIKSLVGQLNIGKEKENIKKINQDIAFSKLKFFSKSLGLISLIGIIDGHGTHGHIISKVVKNFFYDYFENNINMTLSLNKDNYYTILTESFIRCEEYLIENNKDLNLNLNQSGCTCIILFFSHNNKNKVFCANCGNCKCILYSNNNYVPLSYSHSPSRVSEINRMKEIINNLEKIKIEQIKNIEEKKNENEKNNNENINSNKDDLILIQSIIDKKNQLILQNSQITIKNILKQKGKELFHEENLLKKIFIKEFKELNLTRTIGDLDAKEIGIISEPEIVECNLKVQKAKFLVMGTSSLFQYLSIEEIGNIVRKYYRDNNGFDACIHLEELAKERWIQNAKKVEDISIIIIFFENKS